MPLETAQDLLKSVVTTKEGNVLKSTLTIVLEKRLECGTYLFDIEEFEKDNMKTELLEFLYGFVKNDLYAILSCFPQQRVRVLIGNLLDKMENK